MWNYIWYNYVILVCLLLFKVFSLLQILWILKAASTRYHVILLIFYDLIVQYPE